VSLAERDEKGSGLERRVPVTAFGEEGTGRRERGGGKERI